jgi:hypothetical protein
MPALTRKVAALVCLVGLVEDCQNLHAALVGIEQGFGNRGRSEAIRLHEDLLGGGVYLPYYRVCGAAAGRELHGRAGLGELGRWRHTEKQTE